MAAPTQETRRVAAIPARLRERIARAGRVVALTGAGISAESGVPTFRGLGGLWEGQPVEELATPAGFARDPRRVWAFYDARRVQVAACAPNPGHLALARFEAARPGFTLVTQNVDGLHRVAGSRRVLCLHGDLFRVRCTAEGTESEDRRTPLPEIPPRCGCGALLRPAVVWFGELLPEREMEAATAAARDAEVFLSIGTSALVYPAAGLPLLARDRGAYLVEINVEPTPLSEAADAVVAGPAGEVLPELLAV